MAVESEGYQRINSLEQYKKVIGSPDVGRIKRSQWTIQQGDWHVEFVSFENFLDKYYQNQVYFENQELAQYVSSK